ncbi:thermonuclease family protein [Sporosarcina sp. ANT_H38]|uniref:thermonuclease family protein n=1 Tax=Sporosarcina sp. ANT_H38 TaxID=2597358 RepID=UPI0011F1D2B6|nr:thermonuclease family protein [Sporosarcina sp. ANT_H38]KAA0964817.1 thermonuclease family protein [Sporosarcina sp. ANT_H38]
MKQNKKNAGTLLRKPAGIVSIGIVLLALIVYNIFFPEQEPESDPSRSGLIPVELVKTIDGDTIKIMYEGEEQNVRYLLIDTPETNHPRLGKQPFGEKAKERNRELMSSGKLEIEFDIGGKTDKYDRLLAYLYIDGVSVQETLLEEGLARVAYVYPPNTRHLDAYKKAEEKAKKAGIGIWTLEDYATDRGFDSGTYTETQPESGTKEMFTNCTELRQKYTNGVGKGHPAYVEKMDGNKDGNACER